MSMRVVAAPAAPDSQHVDDDTFFIDRVSFTYAIDGDSLTLTPDEATQWSTMVALPGLVWRRVRAG